MKFKLWSLALAATLGVSMAANAQTAVDGAIGGSVKDASQGVIPNAQVVVHNNGTNAEQTLTTDSEGFYRAIHLLPGTYTVSVNANGFASYKSTQVIVQVGLLTDVSPELGAGGTQTVVEVGADAPLLNTTSNDFAPVIDQQALQDLPVNNYRWSAY